MMGSYRLKMTSYVAVGLSVAAGVVLAATFVGGSAGGDKQPSPVEPASVSALSAIPRFASAGPALSAKDRAGVLSAVAEITGDIPASVPEAYVPGAAEGARARVLLTRLGRGSRTIYAFPTSKGRVCSELTDFSGGCIDGFRMRSPVGVTYGDPAANEPGIVWGLAPSYVRDVDVVVNGVREQAVIGNNAYFYQGTQPASAFESLVVTFANGHTKTVPINYRGAPQLQN